MLPNVYPKPPSSSGNPLTSELCLKTFLLSTSLLFTTFALSFLQRFWCLRNVAGFPVAATFPGPWSLSFEANPPAFRLIAGAGFCCMVNALLQCRFSMLFRQLVHGVVLCGVSVVGWSDLFWGKLALVAAVCEFSGRILGFWLFSFLLQSFCHQSTFDTSACQYS